MDYPELNLFFILVLLSLLSLNTGLAVLLYRARLSPLAGRLALLLSLLSLLPGFYIAYLYIERMPLNYSLWLGLGFLIVAALTAGLTALLSRLRFSPLAYRLLLALFTAGTLAALRLAYLIYRTLVPDPIFAVITTKILPHALHMWV